MTTKSMKCCVFGLFVEMLKSKANMCYPKEIV